MSVPNRETGEERVSEATAELQGQDTPKISVIMPLFNGERHLDSAVNSILTQTFTDLELIVVDDGSTDGSLDYLASINDTRLCVVSQAHSGLPGALNHGISLARGMYIARMDTDDIALPERFQIQLDYLEAHPDLDIIGGQAIVIDDQDKEIGPMSRPVSHKYILKYAESACPLIHPTYLGKSEAFQSLNGYRNLVAVEDFDFLLRAVESGFNLGNVPQQVLLYRRSAGSISASHAKTQMANSRRALAAHRQRVAGKDESPKILDKMRDRTQKSGWWFDFWWRRRNGSLLKRQSKRGLSRHMLTADAAFSSLMHYELLYATYQGWKLRKYKE